MRIAVLFSRLSGYMSACLKRLQEDHGARLLVIRWPPAAEAPFDARQFEWIDEQYDRSTLSVQEMRTIVERFDPTAVFMSGWFDSGYLEVARALRKRGVPVIAGTDAQWKGSLRQQAARWVAPWYLHRAIDVLWVAGERQRQLAARLGYRGERCWTGVYACDWHRFAQVPNGEIKRSGFLFVGRYVPAKGLDVLVEAYKQYRAQVADPWPLHCAGSGDQQKLLQGVDGIVDRGFIQPDALPGLMAEAAAFVLPSRKEPWGVVVQEAAAAGLPIICSDVSGAAVHLVQDHFNGYLFESGNAAHLARCMVRISRASDEAWKMMSCHSRTLSRQYTPQRWAATFVERIQSFERAQA